MSMRDVPPAQWPEFLDQFSRQHRAWLATIERAHAGALDHLEAVDRPLASVTPQVTAGGVAGIEIRLQEDSQTSRSIRIAAPRRIRVDEGPRGIAHALEITDDQDERTRIRFRATPSAEMLDGVAPGEVPPPQ